MAYKWHLWKDGLQLRGANIYQRRVFPALDEGLMGPGPIGPPYTQADFDNLAASGANWVNLSVPGLFTVTPPYRPDPAAIAAVDALLQMAARARLYVVISARTGPGRSEFSILRADLGTWFGRQYLVESVWRDPAAREAWAAMWQFTAQRYRDHPNVIGYNLMVEPNADDIVRAGTPQAFLARYQGTGYDWNTWYPNLVAAIREVDPWTPILVEPLGYADLQWLPFLRPSEAPRIVYAFHQYRPFDYVFQSPEAPRAYPGPFEDENGPFMADKAWLASYLDTARAFSQTVGAPVVANEIGVVRWAPAAPRFMQDEIEILEARGIPYAVWAWYASWPPLAKEDNDFNFRLGPLPGNLQNTPNLLWDVYQNFWRRNTLRPQNRFPLTTPSPAPQP